MLIRSKCRPNKPKNGGITAGIPRAGRGRDAIGNGVDSSAEVSLSEVVEIYIFRAVKIFSKRSQTSCACYPRFPIVVLPILKGCRAKELSLRLCLPLPQPRHGLIASIAFDFL
jgi:hypothetical protein